MRASPNADFIMLLMSLFMIAPVTLVLMYVLLPRLVRPARSKGVAYELTPLELRLRFPGFRAFLAMRRSLVIPRAAILSARHDPRIGRLGPNGLKMGGTQIHDVIHAGTFHADRQREFWYVCDPERTVVLELTGQRFDRVIIQVDEPDQFVAKLNQQTGPTWASGFAVLPPVPP